MNNQVAERKIGKDVVLLQTSKALTIYSSESDRYYWLKLECKTINPYNIAFRFRQGEANILYLLPKSLSYEGKVIFDNDICTLKFNIPQYLDIRNYEKRIELHTIVLVFYKRFTFTQPPYFY